jgi:hypothetical protein
MASESSVSHLSSSEAPSKSAEEKYEELNISDEEFAKDNADTADMDTKPLLTKVNHAK